jgi:Ca2+:H+ antiporter
VPVAIILHFVSAHSHPLWVFGTCYVAMMPVANLLGFAGQEFARKMPSKVMAILIETALGSVVEIVLFLILVVKHQRGTEGSAEAGNLVPVVQAAILGSILTNLLLCLGLCFFVGGLRMRVQKLYVA